MGRTLDHNATILRRVDHAERLATFCVEPDEPFKRFVPGQFATLGLNEPTGQGAVRRAYSIASAPSQPRLELLIREVTHPTSRLPLTPMLFQLHEGDRLYVGPKIAGHFTLDKLLPDWSGPVVMMAAGTGLAPFLSMARHGAQHGQDLSRWAIVHGASHPYDLAYRNELQQLAQSHQLVYVPTISRPHLHPTWTGPTGRAEDQLCEPGLTQLETALGLQQGHLRPDTARVLICGLEGTIGAVVERLAVRGFVPADRRLRKALGIAPEAPASLFYEAYDTTLPIDVTDTARVQAIRDQLAAHGVVLRAE